MATVIDALVVTLGLDPKQFKRGAKEATEALDKTTKGAKKAGQDIEESQKKAGQAIAALRNEVLRMAAVFVGLGAIKSFVQQVTQADAATGRMARTMNMSIGDLSAWKQVAQEAGVSGESVASDMDNLSQAIQRFAMTGEGGEAFKYFRAMNIALVDSSGKARDMKAVLLDVADAIKGMDPAKAKALMAGMGYGADTTALALKGRAALEADFAEAKKRALTDDDEASANARNKAWSELAYTFARLGRDILNTLTPALVGLMNVIRDNAGPAATLLGAMSVAMAAMSVTKFGGLIAGLGSVGSTLASVAGKAGMLTSIMGRLGLVGAAGAAGYALGSLEEEHWGLGSKFGGWLEEKINGDPNAGWSAKGRSAAAPGAAANAPAGGLAAKQAQLRALEARFGLPSGLLDAVWKQESSRGKHLRSGAGALGDFQFMPATAKAYGIDPMNFMQSAQGAARMYSELLKQFHGDIPSALAAYNWGSGNLTKKGLANAPLETQNYIRSIMASMRAGGGGSSSETTIGQIVVNTAATDAIGIARDMRTALNDQNLAIQANMGLF